MTHPPLPPDSPRPDSENGGATGRKRRRRKALLPLRQVLYALFFQPRLLFLLQHERWNRAFRLMAVVTFLGGAAVGLSKIPRVMRTATNWAEWFAEEVHMLRLEDGRLSWQHPDDLPYTTRHEGWRVDFVPPDASLEDAARAGPETRGIWLSPREVYCWWNLPEDERTVVPLLEERKAWGIIPYTVIWPEGFQLRGEEFVREARRLVRQTVPALLIMEAVTVFFQVLFYTLLFAVIPYILRSPIANTGFTRVYTFYLYASIPAIVVACVYDSLNLPYIDRSFVFVIGFVIYLMLVARSIGRMGSGSESKA